MADLRSLADPEHPSNVPLSSSTKLIYTVTVNLFLCPNNSCAGPNGTRLSTSINNISFQSPTIDILQAYYYNISGVYGDKFPSVPPLVFDFTVDYLPLEYQTLKNRTEVRVLEYNSKGHTTPCISMDTVSTLLDGDLGISIKIGTLCAIIYVVHALPCRTPCDLGHGNCVHSEKW
ncbi:hypothetical protein PVL29_024341 [Vitis rotundifolia]|uniref:Uncharacterized protein n=1 Tax=Vitis rotundifolia TaxID=103349 RepID=A0AA39D982_VITRO|nr:hypothetical protein PVL29_024341 [Vitis rotundifolia]